MGHTREVLDSVFSPGGRLLASISLDGTLRIWDVRIGLCQALFACDDILFSCSFNSTGRLLAVRGGKGVYCFQLVVD
jgi:WD40 repeat protein